jgi:hypothetical protein
MRRLRSYELEAVQPSHRPSAEKVTIAATQFVRGDKFGVALAKSWEAMSECMVSSGERDHRADSALFGWERGGERVELAAVRLADGGSDHRLRRLSHSPADTSRVADRLADRRT